MEPDGQKNEFAKTISHFLAELLRTRKVSLTRAAEIAEKVVENINLIDTEQHFLKFVKELSADFNELFQLEERVYFHIKISEQKDMEQKVRAFVVTIMTTDMDQALLVLQEAVKDDIKIPVLYQKFPQFKQYIETNHKL